jgi:phage shock protein PspC (stress-responsive transcriptional regulator)/predicted membrane protein
MTITDEQPIAEDQHEPDLQAGGEPQSLRRSAQKKVIAGVAGGISDRFDVDVSIVRVVFVVLTFLWGLGAAIYLAMWAIVPRSPEAGPGNEDGVQSDQEVEEPHSTLLTVALLLGALCIGLLFTSVWWGGPRLGSGIGLLWLLLLAVLLVLSLRHPVSRISFSRVIAVLALGVISVVIVVSGLFLGIVALTGVPMSGGIGQRVWQPTTLTQQNTTYRLGMGSMDVDLRRVPFTAGVYHVTASVAVGQLQVEVPPNVTVDLTANAGVGRVVYLNNYGAQQFLSPQASTGSKSQHAELVLAAQVGIGQVELYRGRSNSFG